MIIYYALILLIIIIAYQYLSPSQENFDVAGNIQFGWHGMSNRLAPEHDYNIPSSRGQGGLYDISRPIPHAIKYSEVKIPELWNHPAKTRHARLNSFNGVEYVDDKPPCARGEYGCRPVNCPAVFDDAVVCWKCEDIIAQPEYDDPKEIYGGRHY